MATHSERHSDRAREFIPPSFWGDARRRPLDSFEEAQPFPMPAPIQEGLEAIILAVVPPKPAPQVPPERIAMALRRFMPYFVRPMAYGFCAGVAMLDTAPIWRLGRFKRLKDLTVAEASDLMDQLATSSLAPIAQLALMFRSAILSMYFDQPEVHDALGFDPEAWMKSRIALRRRLLDGADARPEDHIAPPAWPETATRSTS